MYLKYLSYLIRHKWFVGCACFREGLYLQGIFHDWSKFLPSEFIPYARHFYGDYPVFKTMNSGDKWRYTGPTKESVKDAFDLAWLKHIHRNPHHWQYWVLNKDDGRVKPLYVPQKYLIEMLCDWQGAGRAIHGRYNPEDPYFEVRDWYEQNKDLIKLEPYARFYVEKRLYG